MAKQKLEIECPVCDAKLSIDARSCPKCGADLGMADFQDLENLANDMSKGKESFDEPPEKETAEEIEAVTEVSDEEIPIPPTEEPKPEKKDSATKAEPSPPKESQKVEPPKEEVIGGEEEVPGDKGKKKGLFSKFFGKKK